MLQSSARRYLGGQRAVSYLVCLKRLTTILREVLRNLVEIGPGQKRRQMQVFRQTADDLFIYGKKVFEIRPDIICDKGTAVKRILKKKNMKKYLPISVGDDKTDEDAFRAIGNKGITIFVSRKPRKTFARYRLKSPKEVIKLLEWFLTLRNTRYA